MTKYRLRTAWRQDQPGDEPVALYEIQVLFEGASRFGALYDGALPETYTSRQVAEARLKALKAKEQARLAQQEFLSLLRVHQPGAAVGEAA